VCGLAGTARSIFLTELPRDVDRVRLGENEEIGYHGDEEQKLPARSAEYLEWRRGQRVRHREYGLGRVMWVRPSRGRTHAGVRFETHGDKTLVLEYANLEMVEAEEPDEYP